MEEGDGGTFKQSMSRVEDRLGGVEEQQNRVDERLGKVDERLGKVEERLGKVESDVDYLKCDVAELRTDVRQVRDVDLRELRNHQERDFRVLFGAVIFVAIGITGIMAKVFGWIH